METNELGELDRIRGTCSFQIRFLPLQWEVWRCVQTWYLQAQADLSVREQAAWTYASMEREIGTR